LAVTARLCFLFSVPAPPGVCMLSLHVALPIYLADPLNVRLVGEIVADDHGLVGPRPHDPAKPSEVLLIRAHLGGMRQHDQKVYRSEEHTSELQSRENLVCRLLLEKKKKN